MSESDHGKMLELIFNTVKETDVKIHKLEKHVNKINIDTKEKISDVKSECVKKINDIEKENLKLSYKQKLIHITVGSGVGSGAFGVATLVTKLLNI